ncbi:MAG TPA: CAP domain-containing protein [Solirubrobacterales bacterium]
MQFRFTRILFAAALSCGLLAMTASAGSAATVGGAAALKSAKAREAALRGGCAAGLKLDAPASSQESAMLCLVNEARGRYGLATLSPSAPLRESAVEKGWDLIRCNEFSHTACGREFTFWIKESGYTAAECWRVGENLAWGVDGQGTVGSIFRAWMRSPAHRENILGDFEETGIDLRVDELGGLTGVHIWTQHFGSHCNS